MDWSRASFRRFIFSSALAKTCGWKGCLYFSRCQRMRASLWAIAVMSLRLQPCLPAAAQFAKVVLRPQEALGRQPQRFGHAAFDVARPYAVNLAAGDPP